MNTATTKETIDELLKSSQKLIDEINEKSLVQGAPLEVTDLSVKYGHFLNAEVTEAFTRMSNRLTVTDDTTGKTYKAIYPCGMVSKDNLLVGVQKVVKILNELGSEGLIHSTLAKLSSIKLYSETAEEMLAVFAFVLVPAEKEAELIQRYSGRLVEEGEVGSRLDIDTEA